MLIETEGILKSRPLTFIGSDIDEPPFTPSCLIMGRRLLETPGISSEVKNSDTKLIVKHLKYLNTLLDHFLVRWKQEYLQALREHNRLRKGSVKRVVKVGDIVTIHEDKAPRQRWAL